MKQLLGSMYRTFRGEVGLLGTRRKYNADFDTFKSGTEASGNRLPVRPEDRMAYLGDDTSATDFDAHYTYHPSWAARVLADERPAKHVDISSILTFAGMVSAFIPMEFYDYRPANLRLSNLQTGAADLTKLHFATGSIPSLSCMHTIEHVGLGRYGDPIDHDGDLKAANELSRVLAPGGLFLFVTPVGRPRVVFNAHRIYSYEHVTRMFAGLNVERFALVPDDSTNGLVDNAPPELVNAQAYGCGCFAFRKPT